MQEVHPLISVITVVYNSVDEIGATLRSVVNQTYLNVELIVIDGGSKDGTVDIIKEYASGISYWISEPDGGIYDAMNKGIAVANGLYTIFLNAGDYIYENTTFTSVIDQLAGDFCADMVYGRSKIIKPNGALTDLTIRHSHTELWKGPCFRHGALFAKTKLLKENKFEISERLKVAADLDFIYKMYNKGYEFRPVDSVIIAFKEEGVSNDPYMNVADSYYMVKKYGDLTLKKRWFYGKKYLKLFISKSVLKYIYRFYIALFHNYVPNHLINRTPFYAIRHLYYKKVMGVKIGKGSSIHLSCFLFGNNIQIGNESTINRKCYLDGRGRLYVGSRVSISPEVQIITEDHDYNSVNFAGRSRDVIIEDYVWIGTRAMILPGVRIGKGAVVCAGAVVTKNVNDFDVVAGIPAVKIKERNRNLNYSPSWMPLFD